MKILVLGLGNLLLQDEGVGVRVIERLREEYIFPEEVTVLDGGTLGLDLLAYLEEAERVVIADVLRAQAAPGTILRLENDAIPAYLAPKLSPHQLGLQDLLALARLRGHLPAQVVLWGVQGDQFEPGLELSAVVAAQVSVLVERIVQELARWEIRAVGK